MKQIENQSAVIRVGDVVESEFRIAASAASFKILSSGLYSNKIRAICRELCTNAYDSHVMAGKQSAPFDVILPSSLEPNFIIHDYGTGLSKDDVLSIYTTYFESTKNSSNDFIGQLGLGSKSPFSYTDQFMVESQHDGIKTTYSMFINDSGIPSVSVLGEVEESSPNGLRITIPVKRDDHVAFSRELHDVIAHFDPHPNISNNVFRFSPSVINYIVKHESWGFRSSSDRSPYVIQGLIRYPLDVKQVTNSNKLTPAAIALLSCPVDFIVPIGTVQIAPSREALSYDKITMRNLTEFINLTATNALESSQSMVDSAASLFDARVIVGKLKNRDEGMGRFFSHAAHKFVFTYQDQDVIDVDFGEFDIHHDDILRTYSKPYARRNSINCTGTFTKSTRHSLLMGSDDLRYLCNVKFIVIDTLKITAQMIRKYLEDNLVRGEICYVLGSTKRNKLVEHHSIQALKDVFGMIDDSHLVYTSALIADSKLSAPVPKAKSAAIRTNLYMMDRRGTFSSCPIPPAGQKVVYIPVCRGVTTLAMSHAYLRKMVDYLFYKKVVATTIIYGVPKSQIKFIQNNSDFVMLYDAFTQYLLDNEKEVREEIINSLMLETASRVVCESSNVLRNHHEFLISKNPENECLIAYVEAKKICDSPDHDTDILGRALLSMFTALPTQITAGINRPTSSSSPAFLFEQKYPLASALTRYASSDIMNAALNDLATYINLVDAGEFYVAPSKVKTV